jgi:ankyrin repeat protein
MSTADSELLKEAISRDDGARIASLIDRGVKVEYEYYWSYPIHYAVILGQLKAIRTLAEKGANLNVVGLRDSPPIMIAVEDRKPEVVRLLLELGANPDATETTRQYTPLFTALWRQRSLSAARLLVENGADVFHAKDLNGNNAIRFAVQFECGEILDAMASIHGKKAKLAIATAQRDFALIDAAKDQDFKRVRNSLSAGANIDSINPYGGSALFHAAENGDTELAQFLLDQGATVSIRGEDKKTPLMAAALGGYRETVDLLLKCGADLLEEVIPGDELSDGRDMDAVAFAQEGPNRELYENLLARRNDLRKLQKKQEKMKSVGVRDKTPRTTASRKPTARGAKGINISSKVTTNKVKGRATKTSSASRRRKKSKRKESRP